LRNWRQNATAARKKSVTIRVAPDILESYKTMGSGYTGVMADILKYAVENLDIMAKVTS